MNVNRFKRLTSFEYIATGEFADFIEIETGQNRTSVKHFLLQINGCIGRCFIECNRGQLLTSVKCRTANCLQIFRQIYGHETRTTIERTAAYYCYFVGDRNAL